MVGVILLGVYFVIGVLFAIGFVVKNGINKSIPEFILELAFMLTGWPAVVALLFKFKHEEKHGRQIYP